MPVATVSWALLGPSWMEAELCCWFQLTVYVWTSHLISGPSFSYPHDGHKSNIYSLPVRHGQGDECAWQVVWAQTRWGYETQRTSDAPAWD